MTYNDLFIRACRRQQVERVPVWYMRQAGRYDPEYRKIKEKYSLLDICRQPELAAEVTMMPVRKLGVDAAILYSDIMNPVASIGIDFDIVPNVGPVIHNPIRTRRRYGKAEADRCRRGSCARHRDDPHSGSGTGRAADHVRRSAFYDGQLHDRRPAVKKLYPHEADDVRRAGFVECADGQARRYGRHLFAGAAGRGRQSGATVRQLGRGAFAGRLYERYVLPSVRRIFDELADLDQPKIYFPGVSFRRTAAGIAKI